MLRTAEANKYEALSPQVEETGEGVGVGSGVNQLATCASGEMFDNPKPYRKAQKRLVRLHRRLSRKQKGSANRKKAVVQLARAHKRVADIRLDNLHKLTSYLAKKYRVVVIEDLQVKNLLKNHRLAGSLADCGFYEFKDSVPRSRTATARVQGPTLRLSVGGGDHPANCVHGVGTDRRCHFASGCFGVKGAAWRSTGI